MSESGLIISLAPASGRKSTPSTDSAEKRIQRHDVARNSVLFHDLEGQDGIIDAAGDDVAAEDGGEGGEGRAIARFSWI